MKSFNKILLAGGMLIGAEGCANNTEIIGNELKHPVNDTNRIEVLNVAVRKNLAKLGAKGEGVMEGNKLVSCSQAFDGRAIDFARREAKANGRKLLTNSICPAGSQNKYVEGDLSTKEVIERTTYGEVVCIQFTNNLSCKAY